MDLKYTLMASWPLIKLRRHVYVDDCSLYIHVYIFLSIENLLISLDHGNILLMRESKFLDRPLKNRYQRNTDRVCVCGES